MTKKKKSNTLLPLKKLKQTNTKKMQQENIKYLFSDNRKDLKVMNTSIHLRSDRSILLTLI